MPRISVVAIAVILAPQLVLAQAPAARSGEYIVQQQCSKCHETGVDGAPRIGDRDAWIPRLKQGLDAAVGAAIRGHDKMPARGGMADLTDAELRAAVIYLFNRGGAGEQVAAAAAKPQAPDPHRKVVAGTEILLGIVAAETLRARGGDSRMHGGIPKGKDYYHLNITLHDVQTQSDIKDAQVEARVATALRGETRKLEPMRVDKAMSYGNYFRMPGTEPYRITVQVRRPGLPQQIEATFDFRGH